MGIADKLNQQDQAAICKEPPYAEKRCVLPGRTWTVVQYTFRDAEAIRWGRG